MITLALFALGFHAVIKRISARTPFWSSERDL